MYEDLHWAMKNKAPVKSLKTGKAGYIVEWLPPFIFFVADSPDAVVGTSHNPSEIRVHFE